MAINMTGNFFKMLLYFREQNLDEFYDEHVQLYEEARRLRNYVPCTAHFYKLMSKIIEKFFNGNFHFVSPLVRAEDEDEDGRKQLVAGPPVSMRLEDALRRLHQRIGNMLKLGPGRRCIDIGCGIGGVILDLAPTDAIITGLTVAPTDVVIGNDMLLAKGLSSTCRLVESACQKHIPLDSGSQQAAYAIYALKYFPDLEPVMRETARVLESGGLFAVYDLVKSDKYDASNPEHRKILEEFEFGCGMPALHTRQEMIEEAARVGMRLVRAVDIDEETGQPFHYCFSHSPLYMWCMRSSLVKGLISAMEWLTIFPRGFSRFNSVFLSGTVTHIVDAGEMGILRGGEILLFQKE